MPRYFLILLLLTCACTNKQERDEASEVSMQDVKALITTIKDESNAKLKEIGAKDEIDKLHQFEYKVVSIDANASPEVLTDTLAKAGAEFWDCFDVERQIKKDGSESFLIFCKRAPETLLKYVPRIFGK